MNIKLINMENGTRRYCDQSEVRQWDWESHDVIRIVNGLHGTSWKKLYEIIQRFEAEGNTELVVYESPRIMLLGGG